MRPTDHFRFFSTAEIASDPVIPYNVYAVNITTKEQRLGDGTKRWSELTSASSSMIGSKAIQTSRDPYNNEMLLFCNTEDKWIFRLLGCAYTETECIGLSSTVFENFIHIIEVDDSTAVPTGRFKICDGIHQFGSLPWLGRDFNPDDFEAGESIEFDGSSFVPVVYLKPSELQSATTPTGKFHRDDGTWAIPDNFTGLILVSATTGRFDLVKIGTGDTEPLTVSLTSDGTDLFSDGNKVWTQYNDGSGSGLDADTLDGHHADTFLTIEVSGIANNFVSFGTTGNDLIDSNYNATSFATNGHIHSGYLASDGTAVDSDKLDGYDSTYFATADHTHANATATTSGFLPILENTTTKYLRDDGTWQTVTGSGVGDVTGPATSIVGNVVTFDSTDGKSISDSGYDVSDFATADHTHTIYITEDDALAYSIAFGG